MSEPQFTINFKLPEAGDSFGRWCEQHNVSFSMSCQIGRWHATVSRRVVKRYGDRFGAHTEDWCVTKVHDDPSVALHEALRVVAEASGIPGFSPTGALPGASSS